MADMQGIRTERLEPTDREGVRIRAWLGDLSVTVPWDDAFDAEQNETLAILALLEKMGVRAPAAPPFPPAPPASAPKPRSRRARRKR
jgi:hypothetical protein